MRDSLGPLLPLLVFALIFVAIGAINTRYRRKLLAQNFAWYRAQHPSLVSPHGVICHSCGGKRVHVRGLMRRTYIREHFCTLCGTTLYYSPEQN